MWSSFRSKVYYPWLKSGSERNRVFIDLEKEDLRFKRNPKINSLRHYQMQVSKDGNAIYKAYGKHTEEEFRRWSFHYGNL